MAGLSNIDQSTLVNTITSADIEAVLVRVEQGCGVSEANLLRAWIRRQQSKIDSFELESDLDTCELRLESQ